MMLQHRKSLEPSRNSPQKVTHKKSSSSKEIKLSVLFEKEKSPPSIKSQIKDAMSAQNLIEEIPNDDGIKVEEFEPTMDSNYGQN